MKKIGLYSALVLVVLLIAVYVFAQFFLGSAVKAAVNRVGPRLTQSNVVLASASLSPLSGSGTLTGLTVDNPNGWSNEHALSIGQIHFAVQPRSLLHETIVVDDLSIEQPEFVYETHFVSSNIGDLLKNIESAVGGKSEAPAEKNAKPHKFIVHHLKLEGAKVVVGVGPAAIPLTVPAIELNELGVAEGGLTGAQLSFAIMQQEMPAIIAATANATTKLGGTMGAAAGDAVKRAGDALQKFLNGKK